jgi:hypothetical protein
MASLRGNVSRSLTIEAGVDGGLGCTPLLRSPRRMVGYVVDLNRARPLNEMNLAYSIARMSRRWRRPAKTPHDATLNPLKSLRANLSSQEACPLLVAAP